MKIRKGKRKIISYTKKIAVLNIVLVFFFMLGIGYSLLATELNIEGIINMLHWNDPLRIELTEMSSPTNGTEYQFNETMTYKVKVTNNTEHAITDINVVIPNPTFGIPWYTTNHPIESLGPGESEEFTCNHGTWEGDMINKRASFDVQATGTNFRGRTVSGRQILSITNIENHGENSDSFTVTIDDSQTYGLGDTIIFNINATNQVNEPKTMSFSIDDDISLAQSTFENVYNYDIISTTAEYTITEEDILLGYIEFPLSLTFGTGSSAVTFENSIHFEGMIEPPNGSLYLTIETTSNNTEYNLGEMIVYSFTVENDGNLWLTDVVVYSELVGAEWTIESLAPGESKVYSDWYVVTEADIIASRVTADFSGTATSPDPDNPDVSYETDDTEPTAEVYLGMNIDIEDEENQSVYHNGDTVHFSITILNDSNLTLHNIQSSVVTFNAPYNSLAPGQSQIKYITKNITQEMVSNGEYCLSVPIHAETDDPDNPDVTFSEEYCVQVE